MKLKSKPGGRLHSVAEAVKGELRHTVGEGGSLERLGERIENIEEMLGKLVQMLNEEAVITDHQVIELVNYSWTGENE